MRVSEAVEERAVSCTSQGVRLRLAYITSITCITYIT
jgi:hypothetical protein